jgi:hypothetical protein
VVLGFGFVVLSLRFEISQRATAGHSRFAVKASNKLADMVRTHSQDQLWGKEAACNHFLIRTTSIPMALMHSQLGGGVPDAEERRGA